MVFLLGAGLVEAHLRKVRRLVGPVNPNPEKLQGAQNGRQRPEKQYSGALELKQVNLHIVNDSHDHKLHNSNITPQKDSPPDKEILRFYIKIRIIFRCRIFMMQAVVFSDNLYDMPAKRATEILPNIWFIRK